MRNIEEGIIKKIKEYKRSKIPILRIAELLNISTTTVKKYSREVVRKCKKNNGGRPKKLSMEI
jgi:DNA-binding Lrp family transcriptional regulator